MSANWTMHPAPKTLSDLKASTGKSIQNDVLRTGFFEISMSASSMSVLATLGIRYQ